ncbi:hypothetical protein J2T04_004189 [Chryseobacterium lathyri]|uniref:Uncharacterized protein n=1 Tax=Chryseobacterium lathyri TaxID=395933 RepID=A0ABT9STY7_9FLAO|nr:hypothetical protein [Chryseobacterium lathyri]MDQ0068197.1 hypothetical protein [Chryseobacterium lathyri]
MENSGFMAYGDSMPLFADQSIIHWEVWYKKL